MDYIIVVKQRKRPSLSQMVDLKTKGRVSARTRMGNKWLSKVKKAQVVPRGNEFVILF